MRPIEAQYEVVELNVMIEPTERPNQDQRTTSHIHFNDEILIDEAGFSFKPISGFELELDGSVYMYSEDGNLEIFMVGGELDQDVSIAELNDELAGDFMDNFDAYGLDKAGTDKIQGITGFLNDIHFVNADEDGLGRALICSPYINQFFFILVISTADFWPDHGEQIFQALKSQVQFHPQFKPRVEHLVYDEHPDLTIEIFQTIRLEGDFLLSIEKDDISYLIAARSTSPNDTVFLTEINAPDGPCLYHYDPDSDVLNSPVFTRPLLGRQGEVCLFFPCNQHQVLQTGVYRFSYTSKNGRPLQEIQAIVRSGRYLDKQVIDLNFWLAIENGRFYEEERLDHFTTRIHEALSKQMEPMNLSPGEIIIYHPAPDELETFSTVNLDTDLADCSYMIAESVNNNRALNIGLVDRLVTGDPPTQTGIKAVSSGSPGMILTTSSPSNCIIAEWGQFEENIEALAETLILEMIRFCGIFREDLPSGDNPDVGSNQEVAQYLRRHPLFYESR